MHAISNRAIGLVCASAVLWGLYWMPVRALHDFGINGIWTALLLAVAGFIASLPFLLIGSVKKIGWPHILGALGIGSAFALYGIALSFTEIIRVVLLFYLAPAWSTIIECVFFGRRFTIRSFIGLLLSFAGIVFIFRGELPLDGLGALGDWLALLAGLGWSIGSALMFSSTKISVTTMTTASFIGAFIVSSICLIFFSEVDLTSINISEVSLNHFSAQSSDLLSNSQKSVVIGMQAISWHTLLLVFLLLGFFYLVPVTAVTLWGATQIPPALMSFLLTLEIIAAVASSAMLLGERFGLIEVLGTTLIIAGALVEFVRVKKRT